MEQNDLLKRLVGSLDRHKAENIRALYVGDISSLAEYFVIASGTGATQVRALADYAEYELSQAGYVPLHIEGYQTGAWTLMDYGTVVLHLFTGQTREFYDLDRLWKDATPLDILEESES